VEKWKSSNKEQQPVSVLKQRWQPHTSGGWGAIAGDPIFAAAGIVNMTCEALQTELVALINVIPIAKSQVRPSYFLD
jgi:hypothetical protein